MNCRSKQLIGTLLLLATVSVLKAVELPITANLLLRLDGSDVTESAGVVSSWNNQATGTVVSADFTQSTESAKPLLVSDAIAGHAALRFDGAADNLENASDSAWDWDYDSNPSDAARWTTFIVFKTDLENVNDRRQHLIRTGYSDLEEGPGTTANTAIWGSWLYENNYRIHSRNSSVLYVGTEWADAVETGSWHFVAGRIQNVADPSIALFVDGVLRASLTNATTRQMNGHTMSRIGCSSAGLIEKFDGMIAEILVYKAALSDNEIYQVNQYLHEKYEYIPTTTLDDGLLLHCTMDNRDVNRNGVNPPPTLTTADGNWTVENWIDPEINGTARSDNTSGSVISSESGMIGDAILLSVDTSGKRRVDFSYANSLEPGSGSLSVSFWFKPTQISNGTQIIAAHGNGGSADGGWAIWSAANSSTLNFRCCNGTADANKAQRSYNGLVDGQWYHAVLVIDRFGNKLRSYINGSSEGLYNSVANWGDTFTSDPMVTDKPLLLGLRNTGYDYQFKGAIDDFAIWNRALSTNEIAEIYAKGVQGETFVELPPSQGTVILIN